jgi:hypothetical protein
VNKGKHQGHFLYLGKETIMNLQELLIKKERAENDLILAKSFLGNSTVDDIENCLQDIDAKVFKLLPDEIRIRVGRGRNVAHKGETIGEGFLVANAKNEILSFEEVLKVILI